MSYFAKVENDVVTQVIVAKSEFFDTFVDSSPGKWIETCPDTRGGVHYKPYSDEPSEDQSKALRKNFAGIGCTYDKQRDAFIPPQPFPSWTLNEETCLWDPPVPQPTDKMSEFYRWNEETQEWVL